MSVTQDEKASRFKALHDGPGVFVIPNPWDVSSARILAGLGFQALQRRLECAVLDEQFIFRRLLDGTGDVLLVLGPKIRVRRISRSSIPCKSSKRSFSPRVTI